MSNDPFGPGFPSVSFESWRTLVTANLGGQKYEDALTTRLSEGIQVQPLYHEFTSTLGGLAGDFGTSSSQVPWELSTRVDAPLVSQAADQIRDDAEGGAQSAVVVFDKCSRLGHSWRDAPDSLCADGLSLSTSGEMGALLSSAKKSALPLILDVGVNGLAFGTFIAARPEEEQRLVSELWHDPFATLLDCDHSPCSWTELFDETALLVQEVGALLPTARLIASDGRVVREAGGNVVQELSYLLSHAVTLFRELTQRGIPIESVLQRLEIVVSVGPDFFLEIAKLRAMRLLWQSLLAPLSLAPAVDPAPHITAVTARWNRTKDDPHTNLLRCTTEALSAVCGGAHRLQVIPFLLRGDGEEHLARRLSRNLQHILREEAFFGRVADPGGGSYYLEALTKELAERAWAHFQGIERQGGLKNVLAYGEFQNEVQLASAARSAELASGKSSLVGVTVYRDGAELPRIYDQDINAIRSARRKEREAASAAAGPLTSFTEMEQEAQKGASLTDVAARYRGAKRALSGQEPLWSVNSLATLCLQEVVASLSRAASAGQQEKESA